MSGKSLTGGGGAGTVSIARHTTRPGAYLLRAEQWFPLPVERVFEFFADAYNLEAITPDWLHFHVLTAAPITLRPGAVIDYRLRLRGVPIRWQSEIPIWDPPRRFVDRQVRGPYRLWHHEHLFEPNDNGTLVRDEVSYSVPGGALVHALLVKRDLLRIFTVRQQRLAEILRK